MKPIPKNIRNYLIYCCYDYYCQGMEETWGYFLVNAVTFEEACQKLIKKSTESGGYDFSNPREFKNHTIE